MFATDRELPITGEAGRRAYIRRMFEAIAPRYDLLNHLLSLNFDRRWRRQAVDALGWEPTPAGTYLDLCAGTLDLAAELGNRPGFRGRVIGADFARAMLARGRGKSARTVPVAADALDLPFNSACFDGGMVGFGVRNLVDLDRGLAEAARVLKPGARLVILEFATPVRRPARALYLAYFRHVLPWIGRFVSKHRDAYTYLPDSVMRFPSPDQLRARMEALGFEAVEYELLLGGVCALYTGTRVRGEGGGRREGREGGSAAPASRPQTFDVRPATRDESLLVRYLNFVKLPHTLFALPFALLGVLGASFHSPVTPRIVLLVALAFAAARWAAMGFNRIADREFDARSPRNRNRELPQGKLTLGQAWVSVGAAAIMFGWAAWALNPLCFTLSPLALAWVMAYSLSKRFTWWPHLWLGLSLAIAPVGGWLAVTGAWSEPVWVLLAITLAVATWVAGFDIFYALPDEAFDRSEGLRSAVVRLGVPRAILLAKLLHGLTAPALVAFGIGAGFGWWYYAGVAVAAGLLVYEHRLVRAGDLSRLDAAFFTMNAVLSVTVFGFALADRLL